MSISMPKTTTEINMGMVKTIPPILRETTQSWSSVITTLNIEFLRQASSKVNRETSGSADPWAYVAFSVP